MGTYEIIREAIVTKQQIMATYKGHLREMCPHCIGTKAGRQQALFYQFGGTSSSGSVAPVGSPENWRCIPIDGLTNVSTREGPWYTASDHSKRQTCIDVVDAEVDS